MRYVVTGNENRPPIRRYAEGRGGAGHSLGAVPALTREKSATDQRAHACGRYQFRCSAGRDLAQVGKGNPDTLLGGSRFDLEGNPRRRRHVGRNHGLEHA